MLSILDAFLASLSAATALTVAPYLSLQESPGQGAFAAISQSGLTTLARKEQISLRQAMLLCLERDVWPLRLKNNRGILASAKQARLLGSHAAIIGCGGLGGWVISLLARLGVGEMTLCDNDVFDESNLNRQLFCREDRLGKNKARVAWEELSLTASHLTVHVHTSAATAETLPGLLKGADVAIDCLDNVATRRILEQAAHAEGIPFIHGAIGGLEGFALRSLPGESGAIARLYGSDDIPKHKLAENTLGVPTPTPAATAILQVMLALRALIGKNETADAALWHLDLSAPLLGLLRLS